MSTIIYYYFVVNGIRYRYSELDYAQKEADKYGVPVFKCQDELCYTPAPLSERTKIRFVADSLNHVNGIKKYCSIDEAETLFHECLRDSNMKHIHIWINP